jgi:NADH:ubiquinone oxidoreductase subunit F (NADH-binding)
VLRNSGVINPENIDEYIAREGYEAIGKALALKPEGVIEEIKKSGLIGRGGAGFTTGMKWDFARKAPDGVKYIVCNADEGEPGTFKDRLILEGDPHKLIEAMIIAGYAVGANKGFVYIRGEYALSIERLEKALSQAREYGLLGDNILESGFSFDISIMKGAGAYVCGEETALIESLEGKRGHPRNKPPYPVTEGLWGKPTVVNNVETLANVPDIIRHGAEWFRGYGTDKCPGTKVYTIIGNVATPGLIEAEMGTTLRDIIYEYAGGIKEGKKFKCALIGGAAGAFLGPDMLDVQLDFVNLKEYAAVLGSGAILVMDEGADVVDMLQSVLHFFKHESCGHCVPCRLGTAQLVKIIDRVVDSKGTQEDIGKLLNISEVMRDTSFCPLGQSLYLPISSLLKYFKDEVNARIS